MGFAAYFCSPLQYVERMERERLKKKRIADQKMELDMEGAIFLSEDKRSAFEKLTAAAAKYDKNGPGAVTT